MFTPHLVPMSRGLLATVYLDVELPASRPSEAIEVYRGRFDAEPFVHVHDAGLMPSTAEVRGTNRASIGVHVDDRPPHTRGRVCAIDNLGKGSAGQGSPVPQRGPRLSRDRGSRPRRLRWCEQMGELATPTQRSRRAEGGVVAAAGFTAAGVHCGLKPEGRRDLALVSADEPVSRGRGVHDEPGRRGSGRRVASSHRLGHGPGRRHQRRQRERLHRGAGRAPTRGRLAHAVALALGCADDGRCSSARPASSACRCPSSGCWRESPRRSRHLDSRDGADAAEAIMTTDTFAKQVAVSLRGGWAALPRRRAWPRVAG